MLVIVGKTQLEEHEVEEIRLAIGDRADVVTKARKAAENAHLSVREADDAIAVCGYLKSLFDPVKHEGEQLRRTQGDFFVARPGETVEEAMEGAEQEATRRIRQQHAFEVRSALVGALPQLPEAWKEDEQYAAYAPDDDELAELIAEAWEDQEFEHEGTTWTGLYRHETAEHEVVWCHLRGGPNPAFYYATPAPDAFDWLAAIPTYEGAELLEQARSIYFPDQRVDPASQETAEPAPAADIGYPSPEGYREATRPAAEPGALTTVLMQGIHSLIFEGEAAAGWLDLWRNGATSEQLETHLRGAFLLRSGGQQKFSFTEPVGINGTGPVGYVAIDCTTEPLAVMTGKTKKTRQTLEGQQLVDAVRSMLLIPEAEAPVAVEVGAAAGDVDDLFGED